MEIDAETAPGLFYVSGDDQSALILIDDLEAPLAGGLLLIKYDNIYQRKLLRWFWRYLLSMEIEILRLVGDGPIPSGMGRICALLVGSNTIMVSERTFRINVVREAVTSKISQRAFLVPNVSLAGFQDINRWG